MALFENGIKMGTGLAVGIGALMFAPIVLPMVGSVVKPLIKATIKGGIILFEKGKEAIAETAEVLEDIAAEAKAELIKEQAVEATTVTDEEGIA